jgi:hypothetical protein
MNLVKFHLRTEKRNTTSILMISQELLTRTLMEIPYYEKQMMVNSWITMVDKLMRKGEE